MRKPISAPSSTARSRSPCPRSSPRSASASSSSPSCSSRAARALALHAARDGRRLRDAHVVLPVAHARARRWCATSSPRGRCRRAARAATADIVRRVLRRVRARLRTPARLSTGAGSHSALEHRRGRCRRVPRVRRGVASRSSPSSGATSSRSVDAGQIKLHVRAPARHAHRGDGARSSTRIEDTIRQSHPARRDRHDHRQHRHCPSAA